MTNNLLKRLWKKRGGWVESVTNLTRATHKYPPAVYSCFTKSLQCEWIYLQRVYPGCDEMYEDLKKKKSKSIYSSHC